MKANEFKTLLSNIQHYASSKKIVMYVYNNSYRLLDDTLNKSQGMSVTMLNDSISFQVYNLYDLVDNKFGGKSYSDSKQVISEYHTLTVKQSKVINNMFEIMYLNQ